MERAVDRAGQVNGITPKQIAEILEVVKNNHVTKICAPTGSGKSTLMVKAMADKGARIFISEPTIPAVESLYKRMRTLTEPKKVGKAANSVVDYTAENKIVYCTSGHIRHKMLSYFKDGKPSDIDFCDILMLDEAHNGSLDIDVIISLWYYAYNHEKEVKLPRLILASATLSDKAHTFLESAFYQIKVPSYKIALSYHTRDYQPDENALYVDTAVVIINQHNSVPIDSDEQGVVWLAFAPGLDEVDIIADYIRKISPEIEVLTVHSKMEQADQAKIFDSVKKGQRRLIVATNIAEASITISDLSGIFDTMTERVSGTSDSGGFKLTLDRISKSSAQQRMGRTGRTCPGFCYRMCTKEGFEKLEEQRPNELQRIPLHTEIVELINVGLDPMVIFNSQLSTERLAVSTNLLSRLKMITPSTVRGVKFKVSSMGNFATQVPISVKSAAILWKWIAKYPPFPGIVLVSLMDTYGPSPFYYPKRTEDDDNSTYAAKIRKHYLDNFEVYEDSTDLGVLLNVWRHYADEFKTLSPDRKTFNKWCWENSFNSKKLIEIVNTVRHVVNSLLRQGVDIKLGDFTVENVLKAANPFLLEVFDDQLFSLSHGTRYGHSSTHETFSLDRKNYLHEINNPGPRIIGLLLVQINNRKGVNKYISLSHPIK